MAEQLTEHPLPRRKPAAVNRFGRLLIFLLLTASFSLVIVHRNESAKRSLLLQIQDRCLTNQMPADEVVYDEQPERAAKSFGGDERAINVAPKGLVGPPIAGRIPADWSLMAPWAKRDAKAPPVAVLFLHERRTAIGNQGLICVEADRANRKLRVTFIRPGSSTLDPDPAEAALIPRPQPGIVLMTPARDPFETKLPDEANPDSRADFRFFAGQPDTKDPTRFAIPYEHGGAGGELTIWVQDEQTFYFEERRFVRTSK